MLAVIEVVTVIRAAAGVVFDLELDVDVHAASAHGGRETATLSDEVTFLEEQRQRAFDCVRRLRRP